MCFSASASFAASGGLTLIGAACLHEAEKKEKFLALVPFLFAIQQALEGFQWLSIGSGSAHPALGYGFLFFALILWPIYIPSMMYALDKKRRKILRWLIGIGIGASAFLTASVVFNPLRVEIVNCTLYYHLYTSYTTLIFIPYFIATCGALLISSKRFFQLLGVTGAVSAAVAGLFFFETFISVWCFFAGIISSLIYLHLRSTSAK
ncbi:MAG: DUF6629 family protein [Patescibacteria group bacterium]|jgi:hypothetical protein